MASSCPHLADVILFPPITDEMFITAVITHLTNVHIPNPSWFAKITDASFLETPGHQTRLEDLDLSHTQV